MKDRHQAQVDQGQEGKEGKEDQEGQVEVEEGWEDLKGDEEAATSCEEEVTEVEEADRVPAGEGLLPLAGGEPACPS